MYLVFSLMILCKDLTMIKVAITYVDQFYLDLVVDIGRHGHHHQPSSDLSTIQGSTTYFP